MILDELDLFILLTIENHVKNEKEITTYDIAKLFNWKDLNNSKLRNAPDRKYFFSGKTMKIAFRLERMSDFGLIEIGIDKESLKKKKTYTINAYNFDHKKHTFPSGRKDSVFIRDCSTGKWMIIEL